MSNAGAKVRALRDERRMTQEQLSQESGIARDKIAKIETGERKISATEVPFLADALGVSVKSLMAANDGALYRLPEPTSPHAQNAMAWFEKYAERSGALRVLEREVGFDR